MNEKYSRNMLISESGAGGQEKLTNSKVLVCGAGGIGSSVLYNLACLGIGTIGIVDYDKVELSNLNRQYIHFEESIGISKVESAKKTLEKLNSEINIKTYNIKLSSENATEIICNYEIIIDCFDTMESTMLLNELAIKHNKKLITGGSQGFVADVFTIIPRKTHCLECYFDKPKNTTENAHPIGVISPTTSISGALKVIETLKIILGIGIQTIDYPLFFDSLNNSFKRLKLEETTELCRCCGLRRFKIANK